MPKKTTTNLENELKRCETLEDFLNVNKMELATTSLAQQIQAFIESKGLTRADVVKACNLNEVYAYQIISGARRPSRDKLLRDSIILFSISHGETLMQLNCRLYEHGEVLLE